MAPEDGDEPVSRAGRLLLTRRLVFFGGKGGVGKTTLAAAFATLLAGREEKTLLASTDPAHSTSDVLGAKLSREPTQIEENLWGVEIDAAADAAAYVERIKDDARESVSPEVLPAVRQHLELAKSSPGTEESALFDRFVDLIALSPGEYDRIVFDTAPTGHTLRLLTLPALLTAWVEGMVRQREKVAGMERMLRNLAGKEGSDDDPTLTRLRERRDKFHHARHRLLEDATFYLVLIPERLPIEETNRTLHTLTENRIKVGGLVVNRVLPDVPEGAFMRARLEQQSEYLKEIDIRFQDQKVIQIEQDAHDVTEREQLRSIAEQLGAADLG
ncbi:MAG: ArsA family ATPase [Actinomycetota bacterium]|nr:ArsA family ATPase [Actinomycetota bacterium]